jgi:peroxiredoxin
MDVKIDSTILNEMVTNKHENLKTLSEGKAVLLVFLRHFGCVFCKEALCDLAEKREQFENKGIQLVFVHMSENNVADEYFLKYNLEGVSHVSDPAANFYKSFKITKGSFMQLYGLQTWIRGYSMKKEGHQMEIAKHLGDSTQMPGLFLIQNGQIAEQFVHNRASERPDYDKFLNYSVKVQ